VARLGIQPHLLHASQRAVDPPKVVLDGLDGDSADPVRSQGQRSSGSNQPPRRSAWLCSMPLNGGAILNQNNVHGS
jgi:hypothetical protein